LLCSTPTTGLREDYATFKKLIRFEAFKFGRSFIAFYERSRKRIAALRLVDLHLPILSDNCGLAGVMSAEAPPAPPAD
jgi:hypothetical protein